MSSIPARLTTGTRVVRRSDPDFEALRLDAVWNDRKPDRVPDAIVRATSEDDVVAAVRLAGREGWRVGIRSGGHSWVGNGVRDGGLLLDLSELAGVEVDREERIARVRPATRSGPLQEAVAEHGLFFPTGHVPTVGVGGFLLGGGYGWNSRALGPACLSIEAVDVVLADGTLVHATDTSHPDLMWAVRGSGPGFFGVVTRLHLRLYPAPTSILRTTHVYPEDVRDRVLAHAYEALEHVPREVEISAKVGNDRSGAGRVVSVTATAFCGPDTPADPLAWFETAPFRYRALRSVVAQPTSLPELYALADSLNPQGLRWSLDGVWLDGTPDELVRHAVEVNETLPAGPSFVLWMVWGSFPESRRACWSSQAGLYLSPNAGWSDPADDLAMERWTNLTMERLQAHSRGIQFSDNNVADRWDHGLGPRQAVRLEELRVAYDPRGVFATYMRPEESTTAFARAIR